MEPEWNHSPNGDDAAMLGLREIQTKVYINLSQNMDCNYLCKHVFGMLNNCVSKNMDMSNKILCIEIKESVENIKCIENSV